jgi:hypothetical protein
VPELPGRPTTEADTGTTGLVARRRGGSEPREEAISCRASPESDDPVPGEKVDQLRIWRALRDGATGLWAITAGGGAGFVHFDTTSARLDEEIPLPTDVENAAWPVDACIDATTMNAFAAGEQRRRAAPSQSLIMHAKNVCGTQQESSKLSGGQQQKIRAAQTIVQDKGFNPTVVAVSPDDAEAIDLYRGTGTDQFILSPAPRSSVLAALEHADRRFEVSR